MHLRAVNRFLVRASRLDPAPGALREAAASLAGSRAWDLLAVRAEEEGTLPLIHRNVKWLGESVAGDVAGRLRAGYLRNLARNTRLIRSLEPFLEAVDRRGLRAALTKGSRLALTIYPDPGLRPFWDVDVMCHPSDWPGVKDVLAGLGFEEVSGDARLFDPGDPTLHWAYAPYFKKGDTFLEFHFTFLGLHVPLPSGGQVWAAARRMPVGGSEALILSPEHEFCHLCVHAQQHSYQRLLWLTDIAEMASGRAVDWRQVRTICHEARIGASVFHALRLVDTLWPGTLPDGLIGEFRPGFLIRSGLRFFWPEEAVSKRSMTLAWPYYMPSLFSLWERREPGPAWRALPGILFPPRAWMAQSPGVAGRPRGAWRRYAGRLLRPLLMTVKRMVTGP